ncbi:hypothetical protein GCM10011611_18770 [Aliidongia dinghuensis]|uniref:Uncharacterized protein n=1 Tax=Aliidongia dinghuensis TaxID=1867774 RepID=A0A8J3E2S4_9PROT|nr:hypothetical protein GCM10011611_18770 [Aliidongia dinghuensis]
MATNEDSARKVRYDLYERRLEKFEILYKLSRRVANREKTTDDEFLMMRGQIYQARFIVDNALYRKMISFTYKFWNWSDVTHKIENSDSGDTSELEIRMSQLDSEMSNDFYEIYRDFEKLLKPKF